MDARPQRPVRAFRAQNDENAALPLPSSKPTMHQRHKSTGTLSSMLVGGIKATAKRTAFGDLSNTARNNSNIQDDSAVAGKDNKYEIVKALQPVEKSAPLSRPAQRPLNAASLKGTSNNVSVSDSNPLQPRASVADIRQHVPVKQPAAKRGPAMVFKDVDAEQEGVLLSIVATQNKQLSLPAVPQHKQPPLPPNARVPSKQTAAPAPGSDGPYHLSLMHQAHPLPQQQVKVEQDDVQPDVAVPAVVSYPEPLAKAEEFYEVDAKPVGFPLVQDNLQSVEPLPGVDRRSLPDAPNCSDPEEHQELEEEEYDEDYATAHSFRSRGDNTTGGMTMIMAPNVTNRVRQELEEAKAIVTASRTAEEIEDEQWDTSMVAEYGDEIFAYMRELEVRMLPNPYYMDNQAEIQWSMRSVLMDWLIQVHHRFALLPETLFLCVNYIDRFLSCKVVSLGKLQLVGATAIFVAAKYEEINCPSVQEIVYMVDGGYSIDEILKAERYMLSMLQFELGWPGPMSFLRRISKADDYDLETRTLAKYFLEITIMDERFVGSPPSYIAGGAHALARFMLRKGDWTPAHAYYSGYTWTQLRPLVSLLVDCCRNPTVHHLAVFDKYSDRRYKRASKFVQSEMDKGFVVPPHTTNTLRQTILGAQPLVACRVTEVGA